MSKVASGSGGSQTVDRALEVLKLIVSEGRPMLLEEISEHTGLNSSIAYRLVRSLSAAGLVHREPEPGGYSVGPSLISMSLTIASRIDLRRTARPIMQSIVAEFGETTSLHVRAGEQRICVEVVDGTHAVRRVIPVGEAFPLYVGETGRVFLSSLEDDELAAFMKLAVDSGFDGAQLSRDRASVKKKGFFVGVGERTPNVGSISVAIRSSEDLLGAITISGPANRWSRTVMEAVAPRIIELVRPISAGLGIEYNEQ